MLSPCLASETTDESAPVTTDEIPSVPKLVAEVLSVLTVGHSACRDNDTAHDFGLLWFNVWKHEHLPTWISVGEDIPALFPALIVITRLHMSTFWGSSMLRVTWDPDWWSCCTTVVLTVLPEFITVMCKEFGFLISHESATCQCDSLLFQEGIIIWPESGLAMHIVNIQSAWELTCKWTCNTWDAVVCVVMFPAAILWGTRKYKNSQFTKFHCLCTLSRKDSLLSGLHLCRVWLNSPSPPAFQAETW